MNDNSELKFGSCKWWKESYGFVTEDGTGIDYFAHWSDIQKDGYKALEAGEQVTFVGERSDRGLKATDIRVV